MKVNILGAEYTIEYRKLVDDSFLRDVDWIAIQFTKIQKAFQECDCIEGSKNI